MGKTIPNAILSTLINCEREQSQDSVHKLQTFEETGEPTEAWNRTDVRSSAHQPNALPLGQTVSLRSAVHQPVQKVNMFLIVHKNHKAY